MKKNKPVILKSAVEHSKTHSDKHVILITRTELKGTIIYLNEDLSLPPFMPVSLRQCS